MKTFRFLPALIFILLSGFFTRSFGQGQIVSIAPAMVYGGQTGDIIIRGMGTGFKAGQSVVNFGSEITVSRVTVQNAETIDAYVTVKNTAAAGSYDVTVTTGTSVVTRPAGIQVFQAGGKVTATIIVTPIQSLHLSDFDPNNLARSPLIFSVAVFNDAVVRNLQVNLTVSGQSAGELATATKLLSNTGPNAVVRFDNRQFDKYHVSNTNNPAIQKAIQTGALPSDNYTYHITVVDNATGTTVADADGSNIITNNLNKPELISPGNPFYSDPVAIHLKQPIFQWFSQGNSFDFYVYEVKPGQKTQEEVALNRPLYNQTNITASTLIYPASAQVMENGKVYAWQVIANYNGTTGVNQLKSDLFWFTMATSSQTTATKTLAELRIDPDQVSLGFGQTYKFTAKAFDLNNDTLSITPTWTIIPADGGTIDRNGNFTAGNSPNIVAVVASSGDFKDYATVNVNSTGLQTGDAWGMDMFLKQLFGIPK